MIYERVIFKGANLGTDFGPIHSALNSLSEKWTFGNSQLHLRNTFLNDQHFSKTRNIKLV